MGIFDNAISVVIGNKIVDSITTSDNGVIYERTEHTRLSIDVPLNLTYSDAFNISGNLTASDGSTGISGEEVLLKVDGNVMASVTTGNNGEYSFTQTPVSSGNHTFQVVYAGSNSYRSSESSTVTRTVGKETTIITATVDQTKYDIGDTITVTATLTDDEGNAITGLSRKVIINGYYPDNPNVGIGKGYMTPTNDGNYTFSFTYVNATQSGVRVSVTFNGDSNYTSSSSSIIDLNIVTPTLISTSATNQIIGDNESSTVTAKLMDQDGDAIPNRTLSYVVKHGNDTLSTGSDTTDSNGEIDISYTGSALGKVDVIVSYGTLLQEIFVVYDALKYDIGTQSQHTDIWTLSNATLDRESDYSHFYETTTGTGATGYTSITTDTIIDFEVYQEDGTTSNAFCQIMYVNTSRANIGLTDLSASLQTWNKVRLIITDDNVRIINLDTEEYTDKAITGSIDRFRWATASTITSLRFRNLCIYPL